MQFTIYQSQLKAMLNLASKQDIRFYLCGVNVVYNSGLTRLVATDGHKLGIFNFTTMAPEDNQGAGSLIIPREVIENLPKNKHDPLLVITKEEHVGKWKITAAGIQTIFAQIEGTFPDYARVCAFTTNGEPATYNFEYLMTFLKTQKELKGSKTQMPEVYQNGTSAALVRLSGVHDFAGVIMPVRVDFNHTGAKVESRFTN
jgi:DNA polymerase-3 subunit beta